jgi:predicted RNA-binding protein with RPS1 domain
VRDIVKEGQEVEVRVLALDLENGKISLSLKAITTAAQKAEESLALSEYEARQSDDEQETDEPETPPPPPRKRNYELRGGTGGN